MILINLIITQRKHTLPYPSGVLWYEYLYESSVMGTPDLLSLSAACWDNVILLEHTDATAALDSFFNITVNQQFKSAASLIIIIITTISIIIFNASNILQLPSTCTTYYFLPINQPAALEARSTDAEDKWHTPYIQYTTTPGKNLCHCTSTAISRLSPNNHGVEISPVNNSSSSSSSSSSGTFAQLNIYWLLKTLRFV